MENIKWAFDGFATEIIISIITLFIDIGAAIVYKISIKKSVKQKAGNNSTQIQAGTFNNNIIIKQPDNDPTPHSKFQSALLPFFTHLFDMLDMKEYPYWAYNLAVSGNTRINKDRYYKLMELADHCGRCPKTTPFETFQTLTFNFRYVLKDMLQVFGMHARQIGDDTLDFHKFYHDHIYNHDTPKEEQEYCDEVLLIGDLTFEMTRILNLLLERIREYEPGFMAAYGIMTIIDATDATGKSDTPIEFKAAEKSERPYPGLSRFLDERGSRTHHLSQGRNLEDTLRRELVI